MDTATEEPEEYDRINRELFVFLCWGRYGTLPVTEVTGHRQTHITELRYWEAGTRSH